MSEAMARANRMAFSGVSISDIALRYDGAGGRSSVGLETRGSVASFGRLVRRHRGRRGAAAAGARLRPGAGPRGLGVIVFVGGVVVAGVRGALLQVVDAR